MPGRRTPRRGLSLLVAVGHLAEGVPCSGTGRAAAPQAPAEQPPSGDRRHQVLGQKDVVRGGCGSHMSRRFPAGGWCRISPGHSRRRAVPGGRTAERIPRWCGHREPSGGRPAGVAERPKRPTEYRCGECLKVKPIRHFANGNRRRCLDCGGQEKSVSVRTVLVGLVEQRR